MIMSVRREIEVSHKLYPKRKRTSWVLERAGQVVLCVAMIYWTAEVQQVLTLGQEEKIKEYHRAVQVRLI